MIVSQAFNSVILPVTVGSIIYLGNRKDLMGKYRFNLFTNIVLALILAFSVFTSYIGINGVLQLI
jgi:Mn2+/Fe2+ NRAMP family transporter